MIFQYINRSITFIFLCIIALSAKSQQIHFVYLQSENGQPFYIKLNSIVTSSSSLGYLIIPKLQDGNYNVTIGFPKNEFPEENFQLAVDKKNEGFLLKNFGDNGWGLFNLQSLSVAMGKVPGSPEQTAKNIQNDPFSTMLATVVKDSSILERHVVKDPPIKPDTLSGNNITKDTALTIAQNDQPVFSNISRTMYAQNEDGIETIYIDKFENSSDTIRIFIPASTLKNKDANTSSGTANTDEIKSDTIAKVVLKAQETSVLEPQKNTSSEQIMDSSKNVTNILHQSEPKDSVELQKNIGDQNSASSNIHQPDITPASKKANITSETSNAKGEFPAVVEFSKSNSDCKAFASNDDFIKLRKKIAGESNNDDMLKEAKKGFKSKCFSTEQIKNLSFLFLNDEGKYQFFDAAYAFTSDSDQYYKLQSQLSDTYYINRFKAMIHK